MAAKRQQKATTKVFRKPFYKASDGITALKAAAKKKGDNVLLAEFISLQKHLNRIEKKMNKKYNWD